MFLCGFFCSVFWEEREGKRERKREREKKTRRRTFFFLFATAEFFFHFFPLRPPTPGCRRFALFLSTLTSHPPPPSPPLPNNTKKKTLNNRRSPLEQEDHRPGAHQPLPGRDPHRGPDAALPLPDGGPGAQGDHDRRLRVHRLCLRRVVRHGGE